MAWPAYWPAEAADDIQGNAFLDTLEEAKKERAHVVQGTADGAGSHHTAGDILQTATSYSTVQAALEAVCERFIDPTLVYTGASGNTDDWLWTLAVWRTEAGINAAGFTRIRPREIADAAATVDADGEAAANGQFALCDSDGLIYERVGGAWVNRGPPGIVRADRKTTYGNAAAGDYLNESAVLHDECYEGFNLLLRSRVVATNAFGVFPDNVLPSVAGLSYTNAADDKYFGYAGTTTGWAAAKADAETTYGPDPANGFDGHYALSIGWFASDGGTPGDRSDDSFETNLSTNRYKQKVDPAGAWTIAYSTDFLTYVVDPSRSDAVIGPWGGAILPLAIVPYDNAVFDLNGVTATQDDFHLVASTGPSTGAQDSGFVGPDGSMVVPTWCAEPTPLDARFARGYAEMIAAAVIKFDVVGGFDMRP